VQADEDEGGCQTDRLYSGWRIVNVQLLYYKNSSFFYFMDTSVTGNFMSVLVNRIWSVNI